jgi:hypothetical protein
MPVIPEIHPENCPCCKPKSLGSEKILSKIQDIIGDTSANTSTLDGLKELNLLLSTNNYDSINATLIESGQEPIKAKDSNSITDIINIAGKFLSTPTDSYNLDSIKLDDKNKKLGKFKVKDLSDAPGLDITKVIDLKTGDLKNIDNLSFSISTTSMTVEKTLNFGVSTIKLKFIISPTQLSWFPIVKSSVNSKTKALENLKDVTTSKILSSSSAIPKKTKINITDSNGKPVTKNIVKMVELSLDDIKQIAKKTYGNSKEVLDILKNSVTKEDLISQLSSLGIMLTYDVNVKDEMQALLDNEDLLNTVGTYQDSDCGTPDLSPAPFTDDDIEEIEKDCCAPVVPLVPAKDKSVVDILKTVPPPPSKNDEKTEIEDLNKFLKDLDVINKDIAKCADEKTNALNNYYWYLEASFLNELVLEYVKARANTMDLLNGKLTSLIDERNKKLQKSNSLKTAENNLIKEAFTKEKFKVNTKAKYVLELGTTKLTSDQLKKINQDPNYVSALENIRKEFADNEQDIKNLTSKISSFKKNLKIPKFSEKEVQNLETVNLNDSKSILKTKITSFRKHFNSDNIFSNQAGFDFSSTTPGSLLKMYVHSNILQESKMLLALHSPNIGDLEDYIHPLSERKGVLAKTIWNKYYSANRIDNLFTYKEQGYKSPKPVYDDKGNLIDKSKVTIKIPDPSGKPIEQKVASSMASLDINEKVALDFWANLEDKTKQKIISLIGSVKKTKEYKNLLAQIKAAGENEAEYCYGVNAVFQEMSYSSRSFNKTANSFSFKKTTITNSLAANVNTSNIAKTFKNSFTISYESISSFQKTITDKISEIQKFIEKKKQCISNNEKKIEGKASSMNKKKSKSLSSTMDAVSKAAAIAASEKVPPLKNDCPSKLGSDPLGLKFPSDCPGATKNCYWEEYTKKMQIVSLMPIPDTQFLYKRLFRYYPVGIQIPVPVPAPVVLPTLASGIPDVLISIPLPIIWKHIITLTTPLGMFVIWIGLCGPIPSPYIMYIDEHMNPMFLTTPKGPIQIPANSLGIKGLEDKTLLETLKPLDKIFKVPLVAPFDKLIGKKGKKGFIKNDPDSTSAVLDKIQSKIKTVINAIPELDLDFGVGATAINRRNKIKKAFDNFPPDINAINDGLNSIEKVIDKQIDSLTISPIKYPKDDKKLMFPTLGFGEYEETINNLLDSKVDIGLPIKMIELRKIVKKQFDKEIDNPDIKEKFKTNNAAIDALETKLSLQTSPDFTNKIKLRTKELKKNAKAIAKSVADHITPEKLGFVAMASGSIPLPFPCYSSMSIGAMPPYILLMMAAVKGIPALIDGIPDESFSKLVKIDLKARLPRIEDMTHLIIDAVLAIIPDLKYPDTGSSTIIKNAIKSSVQNFFKYKIRPPKPGVVQIVIPESLIKNTIKITIKGAFAAAAALIVKELASAITSGDVIKVLAVAAIIKALFGTNLGDVSGKDVKAFMTSSLKGIDENLSEVEKLLKDIPKVDFKSIKETLYPPAALEAIKKKPLMQLREGPFLELDTESMLTAVNPLLASLKKINIPFPVVLIGCTTDPSRLALSKIHPFSSKEILPSWEKLSLKNIPFVIWLDQLVATAQRQGGICSDYVMPYYLPDI